MRIIAIEGLDGAGKTTLVAGLKNCEGLSDCHFTGEFSSEVGRLFKRNPEWMANSLLKMYLFAADRAQIVAEVAETEPASKVIVWDRYTYSALVYREAERRLGRSKYGWDEAREVNCLFPSAEAVLFLDAPPSTALQRRGGDLRLLENVAQCYEELWASDSVPVLRIDAKQPVDQVRANAEVLIRERLTKI